jgi:hypothetical protein
MAEAPELLPVPVPELSITGNPTGKYRIALVIDGVVHQLMFLDTADAARFLSNPVFVQIPRSQYVQMGDLWDGKKFIAQDN